MKKKILIVDDYSFICRLLKEVLSDGEPDREIVTAGNGLEAIELIKNGLRPDLIICDVLMPDMDGVQMVERLRQMKVDTDIIFMSGYTESYTMSDLRKYSPHELIEKPILDFGVFSKTIQDILSREATRTTPVVA
jgi:CheY-like chemotaxis protein